jgi:hypothetical protein
VSYNAAMLKPTLIVFLVGMVFMATTNGKRPKFHEFAVKDIYRGKPAAPKLVSKDQKLFRTMIRRSARSKVEFAGHYTVPRWGCGSGCSVFVIVDSISGRVYDGLNVEDNEMLVFYEETNYPPADRIAFHPNSRLLKINGCPSERNCGFYNYEMINGEGLKLIGKELLPAKYQPH